MLSRDMRYFVALSRTRRFTTAAEALGITQPALSKSIRRLEERMNAKLVDTSSGRTVLTSSGEKFAARARIILGDMDAAIAEATMMGGELSGSLRVGAGPLFAKRLLPLALAEMMRKSPQLSFSVTVDVNTHLLELLSQSELDLVFCTTFSVSENGRLVSEDLAVNEMRIVCRADHPIAERPHLRMTDLAEYDWVLQHRNLLTRQWLAKKFEEHGLPPPRVRVESVAQDFLLRLLNETDLISFMPAEMAEASLVTRVVQGLEWSRKVGAVYRADAVFPPSGRMLINEMKVLGRSVIVKNSA